jgi:hypothetical protein
MLRNPVNMDFSAAFFNFEKLAELKEKGIISEDEFHAAKKKLLD